uniref:AT-hook motif nuclear-localized protein 19-like n=1 Tax=Erigeron canadensis TaxID=72917 RepID=UPI001CB9C6C5|nr:AT-hook motif nuclear-localized protein 19-like [Erigeron canadensis]XP_043625485.1 AT-hook motif nuclear-localized protein 19-like [Erigeron canadensis]XP_043625489.1 AT-hook motif nuclear-localized protein 19-like [Erigeron canadensis]
MESNSNTSKRRGRPSGSKNKTREVVANTPENMVGDSTGMAIQLKVLEVAPGSDIISAVHDFANQYQVCVSVISTHGIVSNLNIYQPNRPQPYSVLTYDSLYELVSLKGDFYGSSSSIKPLPPFSTRHFVTFSSCEGEFYSGIVHGSVTAVSKVFLGVSVLTGIDSIKLPLPQPRALPNPQPSVNVNEGVRTLTAAVPEDLSGYGIGRSMAASIVSSSSTPLDFWTPMTTGFSSTTLFRGENAW